MFEWFAKGDSAPPKPKLPFPPKKKDEDEKGERDDAGVDSDDDDRDDDDDDRDDSPSDKDGYLEMKKGFAKAIVPFLASALTSGGAAATAGRAAAGAAMNAVSNAATKPDMPPASGGDPTLKGCSGDMTAKRKVAKAIPPAHKEPDADDKGGPPDGDSDDKEED